MIEAKVICDSIGEHSPRLTTFQLRYPKFIHGEVLTHRAFSRNASSSRAIPVTKNLEEVRSDELRAGPVYWGAEQKGMASGEELDNEELWNCREFEQDEKVTSRSYAQKKWRQAALQAAKFAEHLADIGAHKSIVNRILEPFLHINVVATSCEPGLMNFFGLRLDKAAQPEIRVLAEQMWREWNESKPTLLKPDQWHLPLTDERDWHNADRFGPFTGAYAYDEHLSFVRQISVARCARVSYLSFETGKRSTIEEDLELYDRLVGSHPLHASPAEHQATPDEHYGKVITETHHELYGNLPGWIQHRKQLAGENLAPLPEGYQK